MRKDFTCSQGHHWQVALDKDMSANAPWITCPICGRRPDETATPPAGEAVAAQPTAWSVVPSPAGHPEDEPLPRRDLTIQKTSGWSPTAIVLLVLAVIGLPVLLLVGLGFFMLLISHRHAQMARMEAEMAQVQ